MELGRIPLHLGTGLGHLLEETLESHLLRKCEYKFRVSDPQLTIEQLRLPQSTL
eukprot:CAMPEP_0183375996 /NCGR_PEP_ID=MMETSP0164_2-20130417/118972_1 /TAXON_ID=221442 /ORGANISM="Coccolithus pelagicus ssp braarudi, Strain PLY182g" /LENGTH=53 /DNA_ID=CAMNT_0025553229 /DNA_START=80 /DNA_END=237 /DNA_ORIENTATION=-